MLKDILSNKMKQRADAQKLQESSVESDIDSEIESVLPVISSDESEYDDYRFLLKQLKKSNNVAFKKIVNLE